MKFVRSVSVASSKARVEVDSAYAWKGKVARAAGIPYTVALCYVLIALVWMKSGQEKGKAS